MISRTTTEYKTTQAEILGTNTSRMTTTLKSTVNHGDAIDTHEAIERISSEEPVDGGLLPAGQSSPYCKNDAPSLPVKDWRPSEDVTDGKALVGCCSSGVACAAPKISPLPGPSDGQNHLSVHCHCHSHYQCHHHLHHLPCGGGGSLQHGPPSLAQYGSQSQAVSETGDNDDEDPATVEGDDLPLNDNGGAAFKVGENVLASKLLNASGVTTTKNPVPPRPIQDTTDNIDEIVQDHDNFGTDENEDSLDSVATLSCLNDTTMSQHETDDEGSAGATPQFNLGLNRNAPGNEVKTPATNFYPVTSTEEFEDMGQEGILSGIKRKPDEDDAELESTEAGPSHIKKKRTGTAISSDGPHASVLNSTPTSAPRNQAVNSSVSIRGGSCSSAAIRGVSDVNLASTAFHLDDEDRDEQDGHEDMLKACDIEVGSQPELGKNGPAGFGGGGRQRFWSAGTLNTEEEICSGGGAGGTTACEESSKHLTSLDSADVSSFSKSCAVDLGASASSLSYFEAGSTRSSCCSADQRRHPLCRASNCPLALSSCTSCCHSTEPAILSEHARFVPDAVVRSVGELVRDGVEVDNDVQRLSKNMASKDTARAVDSERKNSISRDSGNAESMEEYLIIPAKSASSCCGNFTSAFQLSAESPSSHSLSSSSVANQQQLMKLIPDKDNPPEDILQWKDLFGRWSNAKRLLALDQLIGTCEPQQVRHMMAVIEPQFQRDFISLLPKEVRGLFNFLAFKRTSLANTAPSLIVTVVCVKFFFFQLALYVLSFLKPKDLLNAAQTCRYWRILAEDNLLWREKCREAGLGESVTEIFSSRIQRSHCKKLSNSGFLYSSWKVRKSIG